MTKSIRSFAAALGVCVVALTFPSSGAERSPRTVGWRGNWTGKFPDAKPPLRWSRLSKQMKDLRCQAGKPKDGKPAGVSASFGSLTEWLVLGPFPAAEEAKEAIEQEFLKDEASCSPAEGKAVGGLRWRKVQTLGSVLDFASILAGDMPEGTPAFRYTEDLPPHFGKPFVAYSHAYVYSPMEAKLRLRVRAVLAAKVYVNGKLLQDLKPGKNWANAATGEFSVDLKKGWNRLLCKVGNFVQNRNSWRHLQSWYVDLGLRAVRPCETESEGIVWATLLPNYHVACPLIVGDRIFAMAKPGDLVCLRKSDGEVLWVGTTTYYDLLSVEERRNNPDFAKAEPLLAEIRKIDAAYVQQGTMTEEAILRRYDLHKQIIRLMARLDRKYRGRSGHHAAGDMPTPVSDGRHVYVWSGLGTASCYDLDGNRKWIVMPGIRRTNMDRCVSPILAGGKMMIFNGDKHRTQGEMIAFDMRNGAIVWRVPIVRNAMSSIISVKIGGEEYVYHEGCLVRVSDGTLAVDEKALAVCIPTPVVENGILYGISNNGDLRKAKLPTGPGNTAMSNEVGTGLTNLGNRGRSAGEPFIASPLYHEGLLYLVDQPGRLFVIDPHAQKIVYERDLGLGKGWPYEFYHAPDWCYPIVFASPMLAGKHIYVFGMHGTAVVFEPGREYREVARNKIEDSLVSRDRGSGDSSDNPVGGEEIPEHFASTPVAEGGRIYLRGAKYLYCIGEK